MVHSHPEKVKQEWSKKSIHGSECSRVDSTLACGLEDWVQIWAAKK
jgi:hypothetical protein